MLGYAQEQRGSELQAGARAELMKTPLTKALVSLRGRMIARILFSLHPPEPFLNYVKIRSHALAHVMKSSLIPQTAGLLVDLHAGYSPMGVMLAEDLSRHRILEIDMPEVIHDKQQRLHNAHDLTVPANLEFEAADLTKEDLGIVLRRRKMDVVLMNGAYLRPEHFVIALKYVMEHLAEDGAIVCTFPWQDGIEQVQNLGRIFRSQVGNAPGIVGSDDEIRTLFSHANLNAAGVCHLTDIAEQLDHPLPINIEVIAVARRATPSKNAGK